MRLIQLYIDVKPVSVSRTYGTYKHIGNRVDVLIYCPFFKPLRVKITNWDEEHRPEIVLPEHSVRAPKGVKVCG